VTRGARRAGKVCPTLKVENPPIVAGLAAAVTICHCLATGKFFLIRCLPAAEMYR